MGLFSFARRRAGSTAPLADLGGSVVALRLRGEEPPAECVRIVFSEGGQSRRVSAAGARGGETVYCFHPGPYSVDIVPFAAAPEMGLRTRFIIDAADPRVAQQRFDLYLFSEVPEALTVVCLGTAVEAAVRDALEQGMLELPPCTSLEEWHAFRAGLNQLLYTRFGVTVDDCIPIDLGEQVDYAAQLRVRADAAAEAGRAAPTVAPETDGQPSPAHTDGAKPGVAASAAKLDAMTAAAAPGAPSAFRPAVSTEFDNRTAAAASGAPSAFHPAMTTESDNRTDAAAAAAAVAGRPSASGLPADDAHALRRLFLELPVLSSGLRLVPLPPGQIIFLSHRSLLQRIALIALDVNTMPALAWAAPGQPLEPGQQQRRARHSELAVQALDQAWALLARLQTATASVLHVPGPGQAGAAQPALEAVLDEADRLVANLDYHLAQRRLVRVEEAAP